MQPFPEIALAEHSHQAKRHASCAFLHQPLRILLVEDDPGDELLTRKAIAASRLPHELTSVRCGDRVMPYLLDCLGDRTKGLPEILMLDLGLPDGDGFEILAEISASIPAIRAIPVVILTGYENFDYVCRNYDLCFLAYLPKPCDSSVIARLLGTLQRFPSEQRSN